MYIFECLATGQVHDIPVLIAYAQMPHVYILASSKRYACGQLRLRRRLANAVRSRVLANMGRE